MKPDEVALFEWLIGGNSPRDYRSIPDKRKHYILEKWSALDFYEYGVSLDLGWITEKGKLELPIRIKVSTNA